MRQMIRKILSRLGAKTCPRCKGLYLRERGTIMTSFGAVPEDEGGGTFCEWVPTCCGSDDAREWMGW